jgi:hypothetical protein
MHTMINFWLITNVREIASFAVQNGADRVFVDLEILGKEARQGHLSTVISRHSLSDVEEIRKVVPAGKLLVRINPVNSKTEEEVNAVIDRGADVIMLPMWRSLSEVKSFVKAVDSRCKTCLLIETVDAVNCLESCAAEEGVSELHVGLNDLHLELGLKFMFELLTNGFLDKAFETLNASGKPFGIGGVARCDEGLLPADLILGEHVRLHSTAAILSRTFHRGSKTLLELQQQIDFKGEILKLRAAYEKYISMSKNELEAVHKEIHHKVNQIKAQMRK